MNLFTQGYVNKIETLYSLAHHKPWEGIRRTHTHMLYSFWLVSLLISNVFCPLLHLLPFLCVKNDGKVVFDLFSSNSSHVKAFHPSAGVSDGLIMICSWMKKSHPKKMLRKSFHRFKTLDLAQIKYWIYTQSHLQKFRAEVRSRCLGVFFIATCMEQYGC